METTEIKQVLGSIKGSVDDFVKKQAAIQRQLDAVDVRTQERIGTPGSPDDDDIPALAVKAISESPHFLELKEAGRGRLIVNIKLFNSERKATTLTSGTTVPYQSIPGIADSGRPLYGRVRQLMRSLPIDTGSAHFVKETNYDNQASPVAEASSKNQSSFTLTAATANVSTIAHWSAVAKIIWDDLVSLQEFLRTSLLFGLERKFEEQILSGDGTGASISGLTTEASNFDSSLLSLIASDGYNIADNLRACILQLAEAGYSCTGFVVSPRDWFRIETMKNSQRSYLVGDPRRTLSEMLWSLPIVPSPAMSSGTFLAGDFDSGAHIRMRQQGTIDISDSHDTFFTENKYAVRVEQRAALVIAKPGAFITGTFATSPA